MEEAYEFGGLDLIVQEAREVLGLGDESTFDDARRRFRTLSRRFHPDVPGTGDKDVFMHVLVAYRLLESAEFGLKGPNEVVDVDLHNAVGLRTEVEVYLDEVNEEYQALRNELERSAIRYTSDRISWANSSSELRTALKEDIPRHYTDMRTRLQAFLSEVDSNAKDVSSDFLFQLFGEMYVQRRRYWVSNLWRNPVVVIKIVGLVISLCLRIFAALSLFPSSTVNDALLSTWFLAFPLSIVVGAVGVLLAQYLGLNPKRQFVPPNFSLASISRIVGSAARSVESTPGEAAVGGAVTGAAIGTVALPGVGTIVGGLIGSLLGMTGKSLEDQKSKISNQLIGELGSMFTQIDSIMNQWISRAKADIPEAAFDAFRENLDAIAAFLVVGKRELKLLNSGVSRPELTELN